MARLHLRLIETTPAACRHDVCLVLSNQLQICERCREVVMPSDLLAEVDEALQALYARPSH